MYITDLINSIPTQFHNAFLNYLDWKDNEENERRNLLVELDAITTNNGNGERDKSFKIISDDSETSSDGFRPMRILE